MIEQTGKHYLYRHIRLDTGEPFYIGIGKKRGKEDKFSKLSAEYRRAHDKVRRSDFWKDIVVKIKYEVEILLESNDYAFIQQKEIEFIVLHGRRDLGLGTLVNLTDGGDINPMYGKKGSLHPQFGIKHSEERNRKRSESSKGNGLGGENISAKPVINVKTLEERGCAKDVSIELGISNSTFCYMLRFKKFNTTNYVYKEDYNKGLKPNDLFKGKMYRPIINKATEELYTNTSKPAKILGITGRNLLLYLNGSKENNTDYMFYDLYLQGKSIETSFEYSGRAIEVIDKTNQTIYNSTLEASLQTSINLDSLRKMLSGKKENTTSLVYLSEYLLQNPDFKP